MVQNFQNSYEIGDLSMKTKHTLIACLTAISFLAIHYVALGATVSGVETDKTPPASAQTKPDRGIKSPPRSDSYQF